MTDDLTTTEVDALIAALENDGELRTGSIDPPGPPFLWEYGGAADWFLRPAVAKASLAHSRAVKRHNGDSSYIPTAVRDGDGEDTLSEEEYLAYEDELGWAQGY